ncbi:MAG: hypothetical protein AB7I79_11415 [Rhizobiaceae bacterium]
MTPSVPGEWARRAIVVYAALLVAQFGTVLALRADSVLVACVALVAAFAAAAVSGRIGLLIGALSLAILAAAPVAVGWADPYSPWGPAVAAAALACTFAGSLVRGRF